MGTKGGQEGHERTGRAPIVSRRTPKGSKRGQGDPKGGRMPREGQESGKRDLDK